MTLRRAYRPLRPEFDKFLFAAVGAERDGIQLSVVSALTRLGLDPWEEAGRLSSLNTGEAVEQLARLIAELPGWRRPLVEARELADGLIERLPKHDSDRPVPVIQQRCSSYRRAIVTRQSYYWVILALAAAVAISVILHGGFPFGGGSL
jgi:hypothetical protein